MSRLLVALLLASAPAALVAQAPARNAGAANPAVSAAGSTYRDVRGYLLRAADQVVEADYAFKPTPEVRSLGQILAHVADAQNAYCSAALGEPMPRVQLEKTATTKAQIVEGLKASTAICDRAYMQADAQAMAPATIFGQPGTRLNALIGNAAHDFEHYGNIVTYMRLKGLVPPSSQPGG